MHGEDKPEFLINFVTATFFFTWIQLALGFYIKYENLN